MSQSKPHFLRFRVYTEDNQPFFAVLPIANFRGAGDDEKMNLSNLDGQTARNKPNDLVRHLEGLVSILSTPDIAPTPPVANTSPKLREKPTQETESLLGQLAAATQPPTPKSQQTVSRASTPESMGSNKTRPQTGGKAPRVQIPTKPYANKEVELVSESDSSSDAGLSSGDEIPSAQPPPQPKPKAKPPKFVQQTLISAKKQKREHIATVDDDTATTLHFSGGNMLTKEQLGELVENAFMKHVAENAAERPKRGRKPGPQAKKGKASPMIDQAGKESSAASSEQKGTPLFMNGPLIFFV